MPTDFRSNFNQNTDIIYGIGDWISRYICYYYYRGRDQARKTKDFANKNKSLNRDERKFATDQKNKQFHAINQYNQPIDGSTFSLDSGVIDSKGLKAFGQGGGEKQNYIDFLETESVYSPGSMAGRVTDLLDKLRKSDINLDPNDEAAVLDAARDMAIRRSSKIGIKYVVRFGKVHYVLDEVNMDVVLDKTTIKNSSDYTKVPIVTSELRYLFRNWNYFKDMGKVLFYKKFQTVSPPWDVGTVPELRKWARYAVHRVTKSRTPSVVMPWEHGFDKAVQGLDLDKGGDAKSLRAIIAAFHAMPHYMVNRQGESEKIVFGTVDD
ncbi:MAG: hypothetical protein GVY13_06135 [Alphaproteobacteria bacterium]|jgi:hypothetical protein|nr:hypothetical protein [Alphaproteobacteria bacterium]